MGVRAVEKTVEEIRAEARAANAALRVPVRWRVAEQIPSSSRLVRLRRVTHVLLLEEILEGRFRRQRGQFLCGAKIVNPAAHRLLNVVDVGAEESKRVRVECQRCKEIARKRWGSKEYKK